MPTAEDLTTLEQIAAKVTQRDGVLTLPMYKVRDAYGAQRLGVNVRENISSRLDGLGISHLPKTLPDDQNEMVRLYLRNSPVGRIITASRSVGVEHDRKLREAASSNAQVIIERIKELVCD